LVVVGLAIRARAGPVPIPKGRLAVLPSPTATCLARHVLVFIAADLIPVSSGSDGGCQEAADLGVHGIELVAWCWRAAVAPVSLEHGQ
jgi:hypothetical protein